MKNLTSLLLLASLFLLIGCQTSEIETNDNPTDDFNFLNATKSSQESDAAYLERSMQWASYITTKVLEENAGARNEFVILLNGEKSVSLSDLIGENSQTPIFNDLFMDSTNQIGLTGVGYGRESPRRPIGDRTDEGGDDTANDDNNSDDDDDDGQYQTTGYSDENYESFVNLLVNTNCIELYMPGEVNFDGEFTATSSAHPLNNDQENDGYKRYFSTDTEDYTTTQIVMDANYVDANPTNIIIARPYRTEDEGCLYEEYEDVTFTDFLGN